MQAQPTLQPYGKPALRSGATLGLAVGVIHSVIIIISAQISAANIHTNTTTILALILPVLWLLALLGAGAWGSKLSGRIATGTLAGLFAGTFGSVVATIGQVTASIISLNDQPYDNEYALVTTFGIIIYVMILAIGCGAGLGALGGLIGQNMSDKRIPSQPALAPAIPPPYGYV